MNANKLGCYQGVPINKQKLKKFYQGVPINKQKLKKKHLLVSFEKCF